MRINGQLTPGEAVEYLMHTYSMDRARAIWMVALTPREISRGRTVGRYNLFLRKNLDISAGKYFDFNTRQLELIVSTGLHREGLNKYYSDHIYIGSGRTN